MSSYPLSGDSCLEKVNFISTILPTPSYWCLIVNETLHAQSVFLFEWGGEKEEALPESRQTFEIAAVKSSSLRADDN